MKASLPDLLQMTSNYRAARPCPSDCALAFLDAMLALLLVEDTPRLRSLLTDAVHGAGWRIDAVATIAEAEEAIATMISFSSTLDCLTAMASI